MKKLRLFPKTFLYTMALAVTVIVIAHLLVYLLAPSMSMMFSTSDSAAEEITFSIREEQIVMQAIRRALPFSLIGCLMISSVCALLFAKAIVDPMKSIAASTERMMRLDRTASCPAYTEDEIGSLARSINALYAHLLSSMEHVVQEKDRLNETERAKADFLRAASHELKTPVTALNATLENMILGVGKYRDYDTYLPICKAMVERLSGMIHDILRASQLNVALEPSVNVDLAKLLTELCEPYQLIAAARELAFSLDLSESFTVALPLAPFSQAVSNILANAVAYTKAGKTVSVSIQGCCLVIENECDPLPDHEISRLFEPFYRPDFSRSRELGGNGLGLYIVDTLLSSMDLPYSFAPMSTPPGMRFTIHLDTLP